MIVLDKSRYPLKAGQMFELESGIEDEDGIELVTYTTNYVDHDFDFSGINN